MVQGLFLGGPAAPGLVRHVADRLAARDRDQPPYVLTPPLPLVPPPQRREHRTAQLLDGLVQPIAPRAAGARAVAGADVHDIPLRRYPPTVRPGPPSRGGVPGTPLRPGMVGTPPPAPRPGPMPQTGRMSIHQNLLGGPAPTHLPDEPAPREALAAARLPPRWPPPT